MSSTTPTAQYSFVQTYIIPPVAAGLAIVPSFYGLTAKSALQLGKPRPRFNCFEVFKNGFKAAPTVGAIVGSQLVLQNAVEKKLFKDKSKLDLTEKVVSTVVTASLTSPLLACLNGQTMGKTILDSFKSVKPKQVLVITGRESGFLAGLAASEPLSDFMKKKFCDDTDDKKPSHNSVKNTVVEYGAAYVSGVSGSIFGHLFDTALTRFQNNQTVTLRVDQLAKGMAWRAFVGVGVFSVTYKFVTNKLKSYSEYSS